MFSITHMYSIGFTNTTLGFLHSLHVHSLSIVSHPYTNDATSLSSLSAYKCNHYHTHETSSHHIHSYVISVNTIFIIPPTTTHNFHKEKTLYDFTYHDVIMNSIYHSSRRKDCSML